MQVITYTDPETGGVVVVHPTGAVPLNEVIARDVPEGVTYDVLDSSELPADRVFRDAWRKNGSQVTEELQASKEVCHNHRRVKRAQEFEPHDNVIMKQIPGVDLTAAEAARQEIRTKHDQLQVDIDAAQSPEELKALLAQASISVQ